MLTTGSGDRAPYPHGETDAGPTSVPVGDCLSELDKLGR